MDLGGADCRFATMEGLMQVRRNQALLERQTNGEQWTLGNRNPVCDGLGIYLIVVATLCAGPAEYNVR